MKFLRINVKVLLILCLFSGILFLSTGCGDKEKTEDDKKTEQVDKKETDKKEDSKSKTETDTKKENGTSTTETGTETATSTTTTTDYSVWKANTTINTDKNQRSYKVIWGDTLWLISTAWDVSYHEIARYNNIPNPDLIYVDQIIYNPLFKNK